MSGRNLLVPGLLILAQLLAGNLDGVQPQLQLLGLLRPPGRLRIRLEHLQDIAVGDVLLGHGHGPHEAIGQRDELLLQVDGLLVPPHQLGGDLVRMEDGNGAAIPNAAGSLDGATLAVTDPLVQPRQGVEMEAGKVQLAQVASVVHVPDEDVHILGGAQPVDRGGVRHLALALEEPAGEDREHAADEVVDIPDYVQDQQHHQPRHLLFVEFTCRVWRGGKPVNDSESYATPAENTGKVRQLFLRLLGNLSLKFPAFSLCIHQTLALAKSASQSYPMTPGKVLTLTVAIRSKSAAKR